MSTKLKHIIIAGFDGALATAITGLLDIFSLSGVSWQRIAGQVPEPRFRVWLASDKGEPVRCINRLQLQAHLSFEELMSGAASVPWTGSCNDELWAVIVPTVGAELDETLTRNSALLEFLRWGRRQDLVMAANCTGTFFLAEAGLLDQGPVTTHWGYQNEFKRRYPQVQLDIGQMITQSERVFCAAGGLSWFDLAIYLIEQELGYDVALQTSKAFVIDYRRENQLSYQLSHLSHKHQDALVARVQGYMDSQKSEPLDLEHLAGRFNVSKRTLIRRFKSALGKTPGAYLQQLRIEQAQKLLAESELSPTRIVQALGYEDLSSFRRLFKRHTGITLAEFRRRYAKRL